MGSWLQKWWRGGDGSTRETSDGPLEMFAVRTLYDQFGREIYARAAADAAFSTAISEQVAELRELGDREPQLSKILSGQSGKVALDFYLLGHTHAVLTYLLEAALRPDAHTPASVDPDFAVLHSGPCDEPQSSESVHVRPLIEGGFAAPRNRGCVFRNGAMDGPPGVSCHVTGRPIP